MSATYSLIWQLYPIINPSEKTQPLKSYVFARQTCDFNMIENMDKFTNY